ncbi:uncharacterized protein LOC103163946 isoform X1 [Cricetulus griseus]|uniref:uncharacterized protein LOC103163946 isoform X1 n=1 Tax=Cricetulus griseus TaxID=10029 RepID=UPI0015C3880E|nr:uncharacterized protein LOC103163946 isoform X1 [Cricetulus griseus]
MKFGLTWLARARELPAILSLGLCQPVRNPGSAHLPSGPPWDPSHCHPLQDCSASAPRFPEHVRSKELWCPKLTGSGRWLIAEHRGL